MHELCTLVAPALSSCRPVQLSCLPGATHQPPRVRAPLLLPPAGCPPARPLPPAAPADTAPGRRPTAVRQLADDREATLQLFATFHTSGCLASCHLRAQACNSQQQLHTLSYCKQSCPHVRHTCTRSQLLKSALPTAHANAAACTCGCCACTESCSTLLPDSPHIVSKEARSYPALTCSSSPSAASWCSSADDCCSSHTKLDSTTTESSTTVKCCCCCCCCCCSSSCRAAASTCRYSCCSRGVPLQQLSGSWPLPASCWC
ncbi:hypothetical protein COO60DRAFT_443131 [Scenedesmus sp. NREL 46B-D3]|nr:hypothetical protein COO60DRAFT_443131 [Scenedesmus sp. NREL 46B-D3]